MNIKKNKFIDFFIKSNTICIPADDTIFNVNNHLNNLILEFFR